MSFLTELVYWIEWMCGCRVVFEFKRSYTNGFWLQQSSFRLLVQQESSLCHMCKFIISYLHVFACVLVNVNYNSSSFWRCQYTNSDWCRGHRWKFFTRMFVKCCPQSLISSNILQTEGQKFSMMINTPVTICFVVLNTKKKLNKNHLNEKNRRLTVDWSTGRIC